MRFGYPGKLATSVRGRLKRLAQGASPAELALGHDRIGRAVDHAAVAPRRALVPDAGAADRRRTQTVELCGGGVRGRVLPRLRAHVRPQGSARPPHVPGLAAPATLGALTDYDRYREEAERNWPWERWQGALRMARGGAVARRERAPSLVPRPARRAARRRADAPGHRHARRAATPAGGLAIDAEAVAGHAAGPSPCGRSRRRSPKIRRCRRSSSANRRTKAASLIVPPRTFTPGRQLRSMDPGPERRFKLTKLLQRGADFERGAFEETA